MSSLSIRGIKKRFGTVEVLKGIDIELQSGEFLVLLGSSGCGKSTLLNIIAGLIDPSEGELLIGDRDITDVHPKDRDIAMVFQSYALYPNMTVARNLTFGLEIRKVDGRTREAALKRVATLLQIEHLLDRKPAQLSGGQRQRVAIGRALVREPKVFLFDEPLSNLDAKLRAEMRTEIKKLHQRLGTTIVYVTHDQIEAMTLATRIAVLKDGILQQFGTPAEIYNHPANMFVADFMGSPAMNLIPAMLEKRGNSLRLLLSQRSGEDLSLDLNGAPQALAAHRAARVIFGIRPEAVTDPDGADRSAKSVVEALCAIEVVEPAGSDTFAVTHLGGKEAVVRLRADAKVAPGQVAKLAFNLDKAVYFDPETQLRIA